jgi:hypothetical protein
MQRERRNDLQEDTAVREEVIKEERAEIGDQMEDECDADDSIFLIKS